MEIQRLCTVTHGDENNVILRLYAAPIPENLPRGESHRYAHFTGLELLSAALAKDWELSHCRMIREESGKPKLLHPRLFVNISHCRGLAVCGISYMPIGVDVESPRIIKERMLPRICAEKEADFLQKSAHPQKDFSRLWTLKEAYGKCTGDGIRLPLSTIAFGCSGDTIDFLHENASDYDFLQLLLPKEYTAAVCMTHIRKNMRILYHIADAVVYGSNTFPKGAISYAED